MLAHLEAMFAHLEPYVGPCWPILSHKIRKWQKVERAQNTVKHGSCSLAVDAFGFGVGRLGLVGRRFCVTVWGWWVGVSQWGLCTKVWGGWVERVSDGMCFSV